MRRIVLTIVALAAAMLVVAPQPSQAANSGLFGQARKAAFDIYSYQNVVGYPVKTFVGGTDPDQARFQVKAWVKKQTDGIGWVVRTIWIDAWREGTNPQTSDCGHFFQDHAWQGDVSVKAVDSGGTSFSARYWPEVNLYKSEGCHKVLLGGDPELNVNSDGLKIFVNGRAFMYKAHDFDNHFHLWWNATGFSTWLWGCTAGPDDNRIVVCDKDGPF